MTGGYQKVKTDLSALSKCQGQILAGFSQLVSVLLTCFSLVYTVAWSWDILSDSLTLTTKFISDTGITLPPDEFFHEEIFI